MYSWMLCCPSGLRAPIGVLLIDLDTGRPWFRMRRDFANIADPEDAEVLEAMEEHIRQCLAESGAEAFLQFAGRHPLQHPACQPAGNGLRGRIFARARPPVSGARRGYRGAAVRHPLAAVQPARRGRAAWARRWCRRPRTGFRAPEGMRLSPDLFVAHVVGRSMEPRIPDGSLNLFRLHPAGSRQGKILLIERFGVLDQTARYTIKRYTSRKKATGEDEWRHEQIRLEPLNPEFEAWDVDPDGFAVVAEWLRVIE